MSDTFDVVTRKGVCNRRHPKIPEAIRSLARGVGGRSPVFVEQSGAESVARRDRLALLTLLPAVAASEYLGRVVGISDAETFTLLVDREQLPIRLAEIDTPEKGQPHGNRARQALSDLIFDSLFLEISAPIRAAEVAKELESCARH